ncbi:MAG: FkbM family methyltransferase [Acidobacteria bacterium]|nr:FkbM family methyltransferase [Acidobacteriota bacterium]
MLREVLRPGDTFVDVGANIGALSLLGSKLVGASGGVYAIEAHPRTATFLAGNIRLNGARNVQVIQAAAGDRDSETRVTSRRSDDQNAVSDEGVKVPMRRLDSLLPDIDVRLMKLDVEGFELFALRGAERVLRRTQFVYFESWQQHSSKFGYRTPELTAFLKGCGFQLDCAEDYVSEQCENLLAQRPLHCESRK